MRLEPDGSREGRGAVLRTMAAGFRMAERDLEAALEAGAAGGLAAPMLLHVVVDLTSGQAAYRALGEPAPAA